MRFNPAKLLLDPYAQAATGAVRFGREGLGYADGDPAESSELGSAAHVPRSLVGTRRSAGAMVPGPGTSSRTRSSTRCTSRPSRCVTHRCRPELRGTYSGLGHQAAISHPTGLGVTAVELLPVHESVPEAFLLQRRDEQLLGVQYDSLRDQIASSSAPRARSAPRWPAT